MTLIVLDCLNFSIFLSTYLAGMTEASYGVVQLSGVLLKLLNIFSDISGSR
jgi:hypothetical protein